ncbi:MAG: TonB-dependent receptor [Bacteroidaceae bacterium]|nr:TonB-dependent receptor [Bacteroidaceae bacterium]
MLCIAVCLPAPRAYAAHTYVCEELTDEPFAIDSITHALDEVLVVAAHSTREIAPVQELGGGKLRRLSVYSVADALRYFSGIQIKDYGGIGGLKTVNVRSMGSQHVGVFYDGVQLGNAQNGTIDLGRFSLDNMESISLYNGQKSSILQSAKDFASASAVYMRTRRPVFDGSEKDHWNIGLKAGSFDTYNPSLLWEHRLDSLICSSVSAEYMTTSGRYPFTLRKKDGYDTTMVRQNGDVEALRVEAALFGRTARADWRTKVYLYDSERGFPGAAVRESPGQFSHQDRQWDTNAFAQGSLRYDISDFYSLQTLVKYAYDYLHYLSDPRLDVSTMYIDNHFRQQESYASAAHLFTLTPWWSLAASTDIQYNTLAADLTDFVFPTRLTALASAASSLEWSRLRMQGSLLYTHVSDHTRLESANAGTLRRLTPTLLALWKPLEHTDWNLRALYKKVFRMPTFNDLYYTFIGNANLKPEYTTQYNLGTTFTLHNEGSALQRLTLQADAYYNTVKDKIIAMPTSNQFRWTMLNLGYVEIRGIDLALQTEWELEATHHTGRLTYTFQKAQDMTDESSPWYGGQIPYIPWHSGSAVYSGDYRQWAWNISFIYTGERYESVANIAENHAQPWYTTDCSLSHTLPLSIGTLRTTLEINNLFNQQYEVVQCYPMPGINGRLKLGLTI